MDGAPIGHALQGGTKIKTELAKTRAQPKEKIRQECENHDLILRKLRLEEVVCNCSSGERNGDKCGEQVGPECRSCSVGALLTHCGVTRVICLESFGDLTMRLPSLFQGPERECGIDNT